MNAAPGLLVDGLSVDRGGRPVLRGVSFALPPGSAIVVTGSNGAGKSTLLRAVAGLIPHVGGSVQLNLAGPGFPSPLARKGERPASSRDVVDVAEHAFYLGHANGLKPALTAAENLRFSAAWGGTEGASPEQALDAVGLVHVADFPVGIMSAGQRRRVALARMLVAHRPLWLLDEPAAALDAAAQSVLAVHLRTHVAAGGMVLAAIHDPLDLPARELRLGGA